MKFRARLLDQSDSGNPDYTLDGYPTVAFNLTSATLTVYVNDVSIYTGNASGATIGAPVVCLQPSSDYNDCTVPAGALFEDTNVLKVLVNFDASSPYKFNKKAKIRVVLTKTGYIEYDRTIDVYDLDIGNNDSITHNIEFNVFMITTANHVTSSKLTKALAQFNYIPIPYTKTVKVYSALPTGTELSSAISSYQYVNENGDVLLSSATGTINLNNATGLSLIVVLDNDDTAQSDETTLNTSYSFKYVPALSHDADTPVAIGTTINVETDLGAINTQLLIYCDDLIIKSPFKRFTLYYQLFDVDETLILEETRTIDADVLTVQGIFSYSETAEKFDFSLTSGGAYKVKVEFTAINSSGDIYVLYDEIDILSTHWLQIIKETANRVNIKNLYSDTITVNIDKLDNLQVFNNVKELVLEPAEDSDYSVASDGIYKIYCTVNSEEFIFIWASFASIEECFIGLINDVLTDNTKADCCDDCADKEKSAAIFNFNAAILSLDIYNSLITIYALDYLFSGLTSENLVDLYNLNQIGLRLTEYCKDCDCA